MRKFTFLLLILCLCLTAALGEQVEAFGQSFSPNADIIDLGSTQLDNVGELTALLDRLPRSGVRRTDLAW